MQRCTVPAGGNAAKHRWVPRQLESPVCAKAAATSVFEAPTRTATSGPLTWHQRGPLTPQEYDKLMKDFAKGVVASIYSEHGYRFTSDKVEGIIPKELSGTLLRNGPGLFEVGNKRIAQPFDGDGLVVSIAFKNGEAYLRNKFVRTEGFVREQRAGQALYRSAFVKGLPEGAWFNNPFDNSVKDVANTHIMHWAGRTLALYERGKPHHLAEDLSTLGTWNFGGAIDNAPHFGAHHHIIPGAPGEDRLVGFAYSEKGMDAVVQLWEFDEAGRCLCQKEVMLPGAAFGFFHDFAVTDNYYVLIENPVRVNTWRLLTEYTVGKASIAGCLEFQPNLKTKVHLIPRPNAPLAGVKQRSIDVEGAPFFTFHLANAFEANADTLGSKSSTSAHAASAAGAPTHIAIDLCMADYVDLGNTLSEDGTFSPYFADPRKASKFGRVVVDLRSDKAVRHVASDLNNELPTISPRCVGKPAQHVYLYGAVTDAQFLPPQAVVKYTTPPALGITEPYDTSKIKREIFSPGLNFLSQEPVFVPRPGGEREDDGWLLTVVLDAASNRSRVWIHDAANISAGPLATLHMPHHLPLGLHGCFTSAVLGMADEDEQPHDIRNGV